MTAAHRAPNLSVLIPARNAGGSLGPCLEALARSSCAPGEIIVVDDASSDATSEIAVAHGAHLLRNTERMGPAATRNRAASTARGKTLVFVDADVFVRHDALEIIDSHLRDHPQVAALFGSYDNTPADRGFLSRYKNLLHHYMHQTARREASGFWTGLGAVRASAFRAVDGFNERYEQSSIEDIELGYRLTDRSFRIALVPTVQGTHAKRWSLGSLLYTDFVGRAIPWARLMLVRRAVPDDLNVRRNNRKAALGVLLAALSLAAAAAGVYPHVVTSRSLVLLGATGLAHSTVLDLPLYRFFARCGGLRFALFCIPTNWLYYLYSLLGVVVAAATLHHTPVRRGSMERTSGQKV